MCQYTSTKFQKLLQILSTKIAIFVLKPFSKKSNIWSINNSIYYNKLTEMIIIYALFYNLRLKQNLYVPIRQYTYILVILF